MENDDTEMCTLEEGEVTDSAAMASAPPSVFVFLRPGKITEGGSNQAVILMTKEGQRPAALPPAAFAESPQENGSAVGSIRVTLENDSVWSRFHGYGTEMILTKPGRRMFPCCRFRLDGLEPDRKYLLVVDVMPVNGLRYRWNGTAWEASGMGEPHVLGRVCVHPESPATGKHWMDSPVSFYKVKLTNNVMDQEGHVVLHSMHRYLPRLHVVPVGADPEETVPLDGPDVRMFTFPKTEFYAVTCYQNPQITQLKIDYNPFAKGFREEGQGVRLVKPKLKLSSPGSPDGPSPGLTSTRPTSSALKEVLESDSSLNSCKKRLHPESEGEQEVSPKVKRVTPGDLCGDTPCMDTPDTLVCDEELDSFECESDEEVKPHSRTTLPVKAATAENNGCQLGVEPGEVTSLKDFPQVRTVSESASLTNNTGSLEPSPQVRTVSGSASLTNNTGRLEPSPADSKDFVSVSSCGVTPLQTPVPAPLLKPQVNTGVSVKPESGAVTPKQSPRTAQKPSSTPANQRHKINMHQPWKKSRKPKSKRWSNGRSIKGSGVAVGPAVSPINAAMQPDLDDVEGLLFVSFTSKEALGVHVRDMPLGSEASPSHPHAVEEVPVTPEERVLCLEGTLLLDLKRQRCKQVIHPVLKEVGLKLSLLDPALSVDLQYLGVRLPLPPPVCRGGGTGSPRNLVPSPDAAVPYVSRTGKTNDLTKIKGWRDKFSSAAEPPHAAPEVSDGALKNHSAFCSDMLDEYLASEAQQQISERAAAFSQSSPHPVTYRLPVKSSSYVRTLDSVLKTRAAPSSLSPFRKPLSKPKAPPQHRASTPAARPKPFSAPASKSKPNSAPRHVQSFHKAKTAASPGKVAHQPHRSQVRRDSSPGAQGSSGGRHSSGLSKVQLRLLDMEDEVFWQGRGRTHITTERANVALSTLLTAQSSTTAEPILSPPHYDAHCVEDFCRLGCVCASLHRARRGPTHCQRPQCMFGCACFKQKMILIRPPPADSPEMMMVMRKGGRRKKLMAFAIEDTERGPRPEPAARVSRLWNRKTGEADPEPLFVPKSVLVRPSFPRSHTYVPRPNPEMREEDKDPVYLYFESMMTCARVREFNSNPPPQLHIFPSMNDAPAKGKGKKAAAPAKCPADKPTTTSQHGAERNPKEAAVPQGRRADPEPTKLLEILSECNWEPHRNLVLSALCRRMSLDLLSPPFCLGFYQVRLLSTTRRAKDGGSTVTYKVCISRADEPEKKGQGKVHRVGMVDVKKAVPRKSRNPPGLVPYLTRASPAGFLKARKKLPGVPPQGLIQVNGKTYTQAKLLLGQMGALHPANRLAAFVTGRLRPIPRGAPDKDKRQVRAPTATTKTTVPAKSAAPKLSGKKLKSPAGPPGTTPQGPPGSKLMLIPVTPPASGGAAPTPGSAAATPIPLALGQKVMLQPLPGVPASHLFCQPNGQIIQLVPINKMPPPLRPIQPKFAPGSQGSLVCRPTAQTLVTNTPPAGGAAGVPEAKPAAESPAAAACSQTSPASAPRAVSLSGKSGISIASGTPGLTLPPSFLGKTGTYSFRICPPTGEGKPVVLEPGVQTADRTAGGSPTMALPGGFTLIKLPEGLITTATAPNADSTSTSIEPRLPTSSLEKKKASDLTPDPTPDPKEGRVDQAEAVCSDRSYNNDALPLKGDRNHDGDLSPPVQESKAPLTSVTPLFEQAGKSAKEPDTKTCTPQAPVAQEASGTKSQHYSAAKAGGGGRGSNATGDGKRSGNDLVRKGAERALSEEEDWIPVDDDSGDDDDEEEGEPVEDSEDDVDVDSSDEMSSENDDVLDIETVEEQREMVAINRMRVKAKHQQAALQDAKRAALLKELLKTRENQRKYEESMPAEGGGRPNHNEKERQRRTELQVGFDKLKRTLNVETDLKVSKLHLLAQAQIMISALVNQCKSLEERKKVLNDRQSIYIKKISDMSGKSEGMIRVKLRDICEKQKRLEGHRRRRTSPAVPQGNPRRQDSEGNWLPPRLGQWKSTSKARSSPQLLSTLLPTSNGGEKGLPASLIPGVNMVLKLMGQNSIDLPSTASPPNPSAQPKPTVNQVSASTQLLSTLLPPAKSGENGLPASLIPGVNMVLKLMGQKSPGLPSTPNQPVKPPPAQQAKQPAKEGCALPRLVCVSPVVKTDQTVVVRNAQTEESKVTQSQSSTPVPEAAEDSGTVPSSQQSPAPASERPDEEEEEEGLSEGRTEEPPPLCNGSDVTEFSKGQASVSEDSNKENPSAASPASEGVVRTRTSCKSAEDKQPSVDLPKATSKRLTRGDVTKLARSEPEGLGGRKLRDRSPACKGMPIRKLQPKKRQRIL